MGWLVFRKVQHAPNAKFVINNFVINVSWTFMRDNVPSWSYSSSKRTFIIANVHAAKQ